MTVFNAGQFAETFGYSLPPFDFLSSYSDVCWWFTYSSPTWLPM